MLLLMLLITSFGLSCFFGLVLPHDQSLLVLFLTFLIILLLLLPLLLLLLLPLPFFLLLFITFPFSCYCPILFSCPSIFSCSCHSIYLGPSKWLLSLSSSLRDSSLLQTVIGLLSASCKLQYTVHII